MPRATKKTKEIEEIEDFDSEDEQLKRFQSNSSDDGISILAAKMQASWTKKKKEKEGKLLQFAQVDFEGHIKQSISDFRDVSSEIDTIFANFQKDYVDNDGEIRKIWSEILATHQQFLSVAEQLHALEAEGEKGRAANHLKGLISIRKACSETDKFVQQMKKPRDWEN